MYICNVLNDNSGVFMSKDVIMINCNETFCRVAILLYLYH